MRPAFPAIPWSVGPEAQDGVRILGINPWVTDFAAFNLWSRPVGLLACLDMFRSAGARVALLDCMERTWNDVSWPQPTPFGTGRYPRQPLDPPPGLEQIPRKYSRYGQDPDRVREALTQLSSPPDLILVTTVMTYWYPGALDMLTLVRELWPEVPVALGGAYASLCPDHAAAHAPADLLLRGPLERADNWTALWALLDRPAPDLPDNAGLTLAQDLYADPDFSVILGSRGCPFSCEYCASNALFPGFVQSTGQAAPQVRAELARGVRDFAFYDDALLVNPEQWLWPLLDMLAEVPDVRLHTPNAVHVRRLTPGVCARLNKAGVRTLRLGLETVDFEHRHDVKLTREQWEQGGANLAEAGFDPSDVGVYILFGLPDQDMAGVEQAVRHVKQYGFRPHLAHYTPIPGSALFDRACEVSPYPLAEDPIFQNNSIWPCVPGGFSWEQAVYWKELLR